MTPETHRFSDLVHASLAAIDLAADDERAIVRAIDLCAQVAERAPHELEQLAELPTAEGLTLWLRYNERASASLTALFSRYRDARTRQDPLEVSWLAGLGTRLERAVNRAMRQPIKRTVSQQPKEARR